MRTVEWLRDHGASAVVARVEDAYYSFTAPAKGGAALTALPATGTSPPAPKPHVGHAHRAHRVYVPPRIRPVIRPRLRGEGVWRATFAGAHGPPPLLTTTFRSEAAYPRLVAGVAWIRASETSVRYVPGVSEPPVAVPRSATTGEVAPAQRRKLLATFNGGFKLNDAAEGFASAGHTWRPMVRGIGTFVRYASGRVDVIRWTRGAVVPANMVFARQNLPLIIEHGRLNPNLSDGPEWGATVGNATRVWRSGIGVDKHGNLLYAAANSQTVGSLARILQRAGAVRALELDINQDWISFITYGHRDAGAPVKLLPDILKPATRYLAPDDRDFFAVFLRRTGH